MSIQKLNNLKENYQLNIERAVILSLCIVIILFILFPKFKQKPPQKNERFIFSLTLEDIPATTQGVRKPPPPKPVIPIPSDDELFPDDITIEDTELTLEQMAPAVGGGSLLGELDIIQPRPIFEVIPEYSEELQKKGIEGIVKLHLHIDQTGRVIDVAIIENTTKSGECAKAAQNAAMRGRYMPARRNKQPTDIWITRTYTFGLQK